MGPWIEPINPWEYLDSNKEHVSENPSIKPCFQEGSFSKSLAEPQPPFAKMISLLFCAFSSSSNLVKSSPAK